MDWSKVNIHCSALYNIMAGGYKSNMDLYLEACEEYIKKQGHWEKLKKKDGPRGEKLQDDMEKFAAIIPILEAAKDVVDPLSKGCKTFLTGVYSTEKYHKWSPVKDIGNRYTDKGKVVEGEAIELVNALDGLSLFKNEERLRNEWFSGHPDAFEGDNLQNATIIHDVKSPYDCETFFAHIGKGLLSAYYWQMQGYMDLSGAQVAKVHFCLINTPEHQILSSRESLLRRMNVVSELSPEFVEAERELINNLIFDDMPMPDKRYFFTVHKNEEDIERAKRKVEQCREYLAEFEKIHLLGQYIGSSDKSSEE